MRSWATPSGYARDLTFNTVSVLSVKLWKVQIATPPVATRGFRLDF